MKTLDGLVESVKSDRRQKENELLRAKAQRNDLNKTIRQLRDAVIRAHNVETAILNYMRNSEKVAK